MKKNRRDKTVTAKTDAETFRWFQDIAKNENQTISNVIHLGMKKLKSTFKPDEITRGAS